MTNLLSKFGDAETSERSKLPDLQIDTRQAEVADVKQESPDKESLESPRREIRGGWLSEKEPRDSETLGDDCLIATYFCEEIRCNLALEKAKEALEAIEIQRKFYVLKAIDWGGARRGRGIAIEWSNDPEDFRAAKEDVKKYERRILKHLRRALCLAEDEEKAREAVAEWEDRLKTCRLGWEQAAKEVVIKSEAFQNNSPHGSDDDSDDGSDYDVDDCLDDDSDDKQPYTPNTLGNLGPSRIKWGSRR
ncbi:hypothetical protein MMC18_004041 [Xylographa bjoerkii]|nr:hypothetical protein [Xylographa bjoerkii]